MKKEKKRIREYHKESIRSLENTINNNKESTVVSTSLIKMYKFTLIKQN